MRTRSIHKAALTDAVTPLEEAGKKLAYEAAVEGIVLLENDGCLPVNPKINHGKLALWSRCQNDDQRGNRFGRGQ